MLNLVAPGPKVIAIRTAKQQEMVDYLMGQFACEQMEQLGLGMDISEVSCVLCVVDDDEAAKEIYLGLHQSAEYSLCHLMNDEAQKLMTAIRALPPMIVFNSLGEQQPVVDKIQTEFDCDRTKLSDLVMRENDEGVILAFLTNDQPTRREFYQETLFIKQEYHSLLGYLRIHAPRYLAKAFAPNAWHMVDLRIFDRYEAYDLQYARLVKVIKALKMGYIVTETWNREVSAFADPVGTYHIRLLTFMEPLELKKLLMGLEYSQSGDRLADLDLFWHNKKISWKDLLDDKETRKSIKQTASFFPKSNFFAMQNDKLALAKYCFDEVQFRIPEGEKEALKEMEKAIRLNGQKS